MGPPRDSLLNRGVLTDQENDGDFEWVLNEEDLRPWGDAGEEPAGEELEQEESGDEDLGQYDLAEGEAEGIAPVEEEGPPTEPLNDVLHARMVHLLETHSLASEEREDPRDDRTTGWAQAASKQLSSRDPDSQLVRDYAFDRLRAYRENVQSRECADMNLHLNATRQFPARGKPDPAGFLNCYPPSIAACEAILDVPDLSIYCIHLCSSGCEHWWTFMPEYRSHFRNCGGCELCRCPHCGAHRFVKCKSKGIRGAQVCWLFFDAFQVMMLSADLAQAVLEGQAARGDASVSDQHPSKPSLSKYGEGKRLLQELPGHGFDTEKVCSPVSMLQFVGSQYI